ncbi:hypothetical protein Acr_09g0007400 [Actinidia rufa]|uniref:Bifunctional inhibitor/plant lipid transfer protein/seed storage helical domain-containing protein n=1 Tax=Actinidia rufa TaxID=165716 RepID=A0A7J0F6H1_9ERIC|nr:hypothetical protein Acr_09g0007400 [Actinidia rufa]
MASSIIFDDDEGDICEVWAQTEYCLDEVIGLGESVNANNTSLRGPQLPPSETCCDAVRAATNTIACVCQYVTPKAIDVISVTKVAFVARACGRPLPHGMTCGTVLPLDRLRLDACSYAPTAVSVSMTIPRD